MVQNKGTSDGAYHYSENILTDHDLRNEMDYKPHTFTLHLHLGEVQLLYTVKYLCDMCKAFNPVVVHLAYMLYSQSFRISYRIIPKNYIYLATVYES